MHFPTGKFTEAKELAGHFLGIQHAHNGQNCMCAACAKTPELAETELCQSCDSRVCFALMVIPNDCSKEQRNCFETLPPRPNWPINIGGICLPNNPNKSTSADEPIALARWALRLTRVVSSGETKPVIFLRFDSTCLPARRSNGPNRPSRSRITGASRAARPQSRQFQVSDREKGNTIKGELIRILDN